MPFVVECAKNKEYNFKITEFLCAHREAKKCAVQLKKNYKQFLLNYSFHLLINFVSMMRRVILYFEQMKI